MPSINSYLVSEKDNVFHDSYICEEDSVFHDSNICVEKFQFLKVIASYFIASDKPPIKCIKEARLNNS